MVDFNKLRTTAKKTTTIEPSEIFRRLPKPSGINDLYTSQAEVLKGWFDKRTERDTVLKLHTGGGKTLVGLLIAQSTLTETGEPVLYLAPTVQLVNQTLEKAKAHGIPAVEYAKGKPLNEDFINGRAIMIGTYKALFNGRSKFGLRGDSTAQKVGAIILDDAHAAFSVVRESFTLEIKSSDNRSRYDSLAGLFRKAFKEIDKLGTFDDILSGSEFSVLEIPYWAWHEQLDAVREQLKADSQKDELVWPLLRDQLHLCHALISRDSFTITPILPLMNTFPTFSEAPRRIYMSATIADDSEIIRTFDVDLKTVQNALTSRSLAGISERMILIPDLMPFSFDVKETITKLLEKTSEINLGAVVLVASDKMASNWSTVAKVASGSKEVEKLVKELQSRAFSGPAVFANRYDGIDLPGDSCRLLVMFGLPAGTSNYELFRASTLFGGSTITRMLAQRIEQGIGRGARGAGDHCVVILAGTDLAGWVAKEANYKLLTNATRAQLEMGTEISKEINTLRDLGTTIRRSYKRDSEWIQYHAETLAELVDNESQDKNDYSLAATERKAFNLWCDGYYDKGITKIEKELESSKITDQQIRGYMLQLAARIADKWGNQERAEDLQRKAYGLNRNLLRPKIRPPYRPFINPSLQASAIVKQIGEYHHRKGLLQNFEQTVSNLHSNASANQFEQALSDLAKMIGFHSERKDINGEGPDVLWILPNKTGLVIEAKSRKKGENPLTKGEHGQLLVAAEWFANNYKGYICVRVSVIPKNQATKAAEAGASHALTFEKLAVLISDSRKLLSELCNSQLSNGDLEAECNRLLVNSSIDSKRFVNAYLLPFSTKS